MASLIGLLGRSEMIAIVVSVVVIILIRKRKKDRIPWASGWVPVLGHALAYKKNPDKFLRSQKELFFRLNLAGKRMIVIGRAPDLQEEACKMKESVLSARSAIASIGFKETLGAVNVSIGTDFHRAIVKQQSIRIQYVDAALREALVDTEVIELFAVVRMAVLKAVTKSWLGEFSHEFFHDFMRFQDALEDATAKAAVLPRFVALPLVLWPVMARRKKLEASILSSKCLKGTRPWPMAFDEQNIAPRDAASLVLGLLFAAHKNPAIAAANAFLFLRDTDAHLDPLYLKAGILETLRLTAHSIGAVRECKVDDLRIGSDLLLNKGDTLAMAHSAVCKDPQLWGSDAHLFNPKRWFTETDSSIIDERDNRVYNVFSDGIHRCPGRRIALDIVQQATQTLLTLYKQGQLKLVSDPIPELCFERATLAQRAGPILLQYNSVSSVQ